MVDRLPRAEKPSLSDFPVYRWSSWEEPHYHLALKDSYGILKEALKAIPSYEPSK